MSNNIKIGFSGIVAFIIYNILGRWLESLLPPELLNKFNNYLVEKSANPFFLLISFVTSILLTKIYIYLVLLFFLTSFFIYLILKTILKPLRNRDFKIIKAEYGSDNKMIDITNQLNNLIKDNKICIPLKNAICGKDPAPGTLKYCNIIYESGEKTHSKKYIEGDLIELS